MYKITVVETTGGTLPEEDNKEKKDLTQETTKEIYSQTVDKLDIKKLIEIVNDITSRY